MTKPKVKKPELKKIDPKLKEYGMKMNFAFEEKERDALKKNIDSMHDIIGTTLANAETLLLAERTALVFSMVNFRSLLDNWDARTADLEGRVNGKWEKKK